MNRKIKQHKLFSQSDYDYLHRKGYTDQEILHFWNRDAQRGIRVPLQHRPQPNIQKYLSTTLNKESK